MGLQKGTKGLSACGAPHLFFHPPKKHPPPLDPPLLGPEVGGIRHFRPGSRRADLGKLRGRPSPFARATQSGSPGGSGSPQQPTGAPRAEEAAVALTQLPSVARCLREPLGAPALRKGALGMGDKDLPKC